MSQEVKKAIMANNAKFRELIKKGDAAGIANLYTEDSCLLPVNSDLIKGRNTIKEYWTGGIAALGLKDLELKTVEVVGTGDYVTELGTYITRAQPKGQKAFEDRGKYLVVWKHTSKGWQLHWDMWSTSLPAA